MRSSFFFRPYNFVFQESRHGLTTFLIQSSPSDSDPLPLGLWSSYLIFLLQKVKFRMFSTTKHTNWDFSIGCSCRVWILGKSYEYICLEEKFYDSAFFLVLLILIIKIGTAQLHAQNNVHVQNIYIYIFIFWKDVLSEWVLTNLISFISYYP